jgi:hypothetical protein
MVDVMEKIIQKINQLKQLRDLINWDIEDPRIEQSNQLQDEIVEELLPLMDALCATGLINCVVFDSKTDNCISLEAFDAVQNGGFQLNCEIEDLKSEFNEVVKINRKQCSNVALR